MGRIGRIALRSLLATSSVLVGGALGIGWSLHTGNPYTFAPSLRLLCYGAQFAPGSPRIEFDEAHGAFREGKLSFKDLKILIKGSGKKDFDLQIKRAEIVYGKSVLNFLWNVKEHTAREIQFETVHIDGAKGTVDIISPSKHPPPKLSVKDLILKNIQLEVTDHTGKHGQSEPFTFPSFALYTFNGHDIHTTTIMKDILLSSTLLGSFGPGLFSIQREGPDKVLFKSRNLPIGTVSKYLKEPFSWFTQATMDSEILDQPSGVEHKLDFSIQLRNLSPDPNANNTKSSIYKVALPMLTDYIKKNDAQIPLKFSVYMEEGELDLADISQQIALQLVQKMVRERHQQLKDGWEDLRQYVWSLKETVK